jgi:4-aminobutyrate--pyruvate transaminase
MFGCQTYGLRPDLITAAKALSAGYQPIGAVLLGEPMHQVLLAQSRRIGTFGHGFTTGGHPVAAAVALRTLQIYEEDDILGQVRACIPQFARRIRELAGHPLVGDARSIGLVGAIELMADGPRRIPFAPELKVGARVAQRALEQGLILRPLVDTISFCPPLIIRPAEVDFLFDVVGRALDQVAAELTGPARAAGRVRRREIAC